jgi:arylsulfatase A-like enzyme
MSAQPNLLMIVTDQEQPWALLPRALTLPGRERLAERATHFRRFHISGSICSPCRSVLYTGQHWQTTGVFDNIGFPEMRLFSPEKTPTLGNILQAQGYRTGYRGKWHVTRVLGNNAQVNRHALADCGFETYQDLPDVNGPQDGFRRDPIALKDATAFFAEDDARPWFLALNYINPHDIMFARMFDAQMPLAGQRGIRPPPDDPLYAHTFQENLPPNFGPASLAGKPAAYTASNEVYKLMLGDMPWDRPEIWRAFRQYYFQCLADVDRHIAALLDVLAMVRGGDNTVVVFTTDHGEMLGAHGLRDKGPGAHRELANIPFLVSHPDLRTARETDALMSQVDAVPTILSLLGLSARDVAGRYSGPGRDMSGAAFGEADPRSQTGVLLGTGNLIFLDPEYVRERYRRSGATSGTPDPQKMAGVKRNFAARGAMRGIHDGRYKFMRWFALNDHHTPRDYAELIARNDLELYDTIKDPFEIDNLANAPDKVKAELVRLNAMTNRLIADEVGIDDGRHMILER